MLKDKDILSLLIDKIDSQELKILCDEYKRIYVYTTILEDFKTFKINKDKCTVSRSQHNKHCIHIDIVGLLNKYINLKTYNFLTWDTDPLCSLYNNNNIVLPFYSKGYVYLNFDNNGNELIPIFKQKIIKKIRKEKIYRLLNSVL